MWNRSHPAAAPGFAQATDPFAGLSRDAEEEEEEIDFEETYDEFNDDTFGGAISEPTGGSRPVGTDFDFFGRTAEVSNAIEEEQLVFQRQQPTVRSPPKAEPGRRPVRSGYEVYQNPGHVEDLVADPSIWGKPPSKSTVPSGSHHDSSKKMMTLEEIEAQLASSSGIPPHQVQQQVQPQDISRTHPLHYQQQRHADLRFYQQASPPHSNQHMQQQQQQQQQHQAQAQNYAQQPPMSPMRQGIPPAHSIDRSAAAQIVTHPQQLMHMSHNERAAALAEDAKRAKRNHKIWLLSKDNGLMTPQDKNFITRIQLQQLMAATGGTEEKDPDSALSEDFYYQVITSLRGGPRQNPNQPLSHFAQTYLFQTGGRTAGNRRHGRAENHMQRMEQQVQRAVEAAKLKPKSKQLVLEGSLGKISFSNAKTPKPLLNIKRHESADLTRRPGSRNQAGERLTGNDRKSILSNIEVVYGTLMRLEDEVRKEPFLSSDTQVTDDFKQAHMQWLEGIHQIRDQLWDELKVHEAINPGSNIPHPFIAFLSYSKGKKAIPRIFRHLSSEQRVTMLTMVVIHLDILDVIRRGALSPGESHLPAEIREAVELFSMTVTQSLFGYVSEAPLHTIIGLLGLILERVNVTHVARTKVGLGILTMLTSRATLVREAGEANDQDWTQYLEFYNKLFDVVEPILAGIFPSSLNVDDVYAWQFLAALGSGATPEQQQRLVIAVKDRVMETVGQSKTLPPDMAGQKRANVNLFMRAIGLDVDLLG